MTQELLCSSFIKVRKATEKGSDTDIRKGTENTLPASLIKNLYTFSDPLPQHIS